MDPYQVLHSLRQNGGSGERPAGYRNANGRGSSHSGQFRPPLSRVQHQQPRHAQPRSPPVPDSSAAFYDLVQKNNFPEPKFAVVNGATKKSKFPEFMAKVTVGDRSWKTHPRTFSTEDEARKCAMTIAYQDLCNGVGSLSVLPEQPVSEKEFLQRVLEIVENEPTGMIDDAVIKEYIQRFKSNVPSNWIEILSASGDQITLSEYNVHNKTVYTIFPPANVKTQTTKAAVAMSSLSLGPPTNSIKPEPVKIETVTKVPEPEASLKPDPAANGGLVPVSKTNGKLSVETEIESNGDMLTTLAIIPYAIPPSISVDPKSDFFDIYVTLAASPHHFFVQPYASILPGGDGQPVGALHQLTVDMKKFYDNEENRLPIPESTVKKGVAFAVQHTDTCWHRVVVEHVIPDSDPPQVACSFVDRGEIRVIKIEDLQPLYSQFQKLPRQAMKASLSNVVPIDGDWSVAATLKFKQIVESNAFVSVVRGIEGVGTQMVLKLQVIDTRTPDVDLDIGKVLVEENLAIYIKH